jgi:hypothetical protein
MGDGMRLVERARKHPGMIGATLATLILFAIAGILAGFELLHFGTPDKVVRVVSFPDQPGFWEKYQTLLAGVFAAIGGGLAYFGAVCSARILHRSETKKQKREHKRADKLRMAEIADQKNRTRSVVIAYCDFLKSYIDTGIQETTIALKNINAETPRAQAAQAFNGFMHPMPRYEQMAFANPKDDHLPTKVIQHIMTAEHNLSITNINFAKMKMEFENTSTDRYTGSDAAVICSALKAGIKDYNSIVSAIEMINFLLPAEVISHLTPLPPETAPKD